MNKLSTINDWGKHFDKQSKPYLQMIHRCLEALSADEMFSKNYGKEFKALLALNEHSQDKIEKSIGYCPYCQEIIEEDQPKGYSPFDNQIFHKWCLDELLDGETSAEAKTRIDRADNS